MEYNIDSHKLFIENGIIKKIYLYCNGEYKFLIRQKCDENTFLDAIKIIIELMISKNINTVIDICSKLRDEEDLEFIKDLCSNVNLPKLKETNETLTGVYPLINDGFNFIIFRESKIKMICTNGYKYTSRDDEHFLIIFRHVLKEIIEYNYDGFLQIYASIKDDIEAFNIADLLYNEYEEKLSKLRIKK